MRALTLAVRRARAHAGTLATLAVLIAVVAAILAGAVGYSRAAGIATVRTTLEAAAPTAAGFQVQTRLADDPATQDAALRGALADLLPGISLDVTRTLSTEAATAHLAQSPAGDEAAEPAQARVVLGELPADERAVVVTAGDRPAPGEVLVPEQTADEAGLSLGAELTVRESVLTVSGTWTPADEEDRLWFADPLVTAGADAGAYGPLLTDAGTITATDPAPFARWTVYPAATTLAVADLRALTDGLAQLDHALGSDDALAVRGLTIEGTLAQTVADLQRATSTAAAVGLVPVALLAIISLIALVQVVRLLGQARAREVEILVARGASPRQVTRWGGLELAAVTVPAAGVGTALAAVAVGRLDGGAAQREVVVATGVAVAVVALVAGTLVTGLQARSVARRMAADRSGRLQGAAATGTVLLTAAAAVLSAWQLLRHGTPLVVAHDGTTQADALAVVSLGAVLAALAVLALALLGPAARLLAGLRARSRGLVGVLAARQVSRRVRAYAVPLVLIVLAAASGTVAASFAGATFTQRDHVAALSTGTDVRVSMPAGATSRLASPQAVSTTPYTELDGVTAAGSVLRGAATFGELPVALTALDAPRVAELMRVPEQIDLTAAGGLRTWDAPGVVVPAGTEELELTVRARAGFLQTVLDEHAQHAEYQLDELLDAGYSEDEAREMVEAMDSRLTRELDLRTTVWLVDADGAPSMLDGGVLTARLDTQVADVGPRMSDHTVTAPLPGPGEYRVVAVDVDYDRPELDSFLSYEIVGLEADGASLPLGERPWTQVRGPESAEMYAHRTIGTIGRVVADWQAGPVSVRLMAEGPPTDVPALVSEPLAAAADLAAGWAATVNHRGVSVAVVGEGVVPAVPGGLEEHAVLVDLQTLTGHVLGAQDSVLLPGQVWLVTEDGADLAAVAAAVGELAGPQGEVEVAGRELTDSAASVRETFWIAAAGATLLALTGVAAVALALARERRSEVMVLRALGLPPGGQARSRAAELLGVGVVGSVLGVLAGLAAAALLVPTLARAAATHTTPLALGSGRLDLLPALGLLAVLGAGLAVVAAVVAGRVRSQALDAEYREEVR